MKSVPQIPIKAKFLSVILLMIWIESILGFKWGPGPSLSFLNIISSIILLCATYCLFRKKETTLILIELFLFLSGLIFIINIFKFGIYDEWSKISISLILFFSVILLLSDISVRQLYPLSEKFKKQIKITSWVLVVLSVAVVILGGIAHYNFFKGKKFSRPTKKFIAASMDPLDANLYRIEKQFGWEIPVPVNLIGQSSEDSIMRFYFNDDKTEGVIVSGPALFDEFYKSMPFLRKFSVYEILQKIRHENIGIVYRVMGSLTFGETVYDLCIGDLKGLEEVRLNPEGSADVVTLFRDGHHFIQIVFISKTGKLPHAQIQDVLSHVRYVGK